MGPNEGNRHSNFTVPAKLLPKLIYMFLLLFPVTDSQTWAAQGAERVPSTSELPLWPGRSNPRPRSQRHPLCATSRKRGLHHTYTNSKAQSANSSNPRLLRIIPQGFKKHNSDRSPWTGATWPAPWGAGWELPRPRARAVALGLGKPAKPRQGRAERARAQDRTRTNAGSKTVLRSVTWKRFRASGLPG